MAASPAPHAGGEEDTEPPMLAEPESSSGASRLAPLAAPQSHAFGLRAAYAASLTAFSATQDADLPAAQRLVDYTRAGMSPSPAELAHQHPDAPVPLTATQQSSLDSWMRGCPGSAFPTRSEALRHSREGMVLASADGETRALLEAARRDIPSAQSPADMAAAAFHSGYAALKPITNPGFTHPLPPMDGELPKVDPLGLFTAHKEGCSNCTVGSPCHGVAVISLLSGVTWPWRDGLQPSAATREALSNNPSPSPYDPDLVAHVLKCQRLGALIPCKKEDIVHFSHTFVAQASVGDLPPSVEAAIEAGGRSGSAAAFAEAKARAGRYLSAYERALSPPPTGGSAGSGGIAHCPTGPRPTASAVLDAAKAASAAAFPRQKGRMVVAMAPLSPHFVALRCRYARLMDALRLVRRGWWMCKVDAQAGYFQLPVHPSNMPFCGVAIHMHPEGEPHYFMWGRMPMGCGPSGYVFSMFSSMVHEVFLRRWATTDSARSGAQLVSFVYLDDIVLFASSQQACQEARALLLATMRECGMTPNMDKSPEPAGAGGAHSSMVALGIRVDLSAMSVHLPAEKQVRTLCGALVLQHCAAASMPVPEISIAQLGGRLVWWGSIDALLPSHTRSLCVWMDWSRWYNKFSAWRRSAYYWDGPKAAEQRADLEWFLRRAAAGALQGAKLLEDPSRPVVYATGDASGPANAVAILLHGVLLRVVMPDCERVAIPVLEACALPLLVWRHRESLRGCTIVAGSDALGASYWISGGKARRDDANDLCKLLRLACEHYDIVIVIKWLTRWWNLLPDQGADHPLHTLATRGVPVPPVMREITVRGLPCDFFKSWALELDPDFKFSAAWQAQNDRGSQ